MLDDTIIVPAHRTRTAQHWCTRTPPCHAREEVPLSRRVCGRRSDGHGPGSAGLGEGCAAAVAAAAAAALLLDAVLPMVLLAPPVAACAPRCRCRSKPAQPARHATPTVSARVTSYYRLDAKVKLADSEQIAPQNHPTLCFHTTPATLRAAALLAPTSLLSGCSPPLYLCLPISDKKNDAQLQRGGGKRTRHNSTRVCPLRASCAQSARGHAHACWTHCIVRASDSVARRRFTCACTRGPQKSMRSAKPMMAS